MPNPVGWCGSAIGAGGVQSVTGGTDITTTGTATDPVVNVSTSPIFTATAVGSIGTTVQGFSSSQTADVLDVLKNTGGTKLFSVVPQSTAGNVVSTFSGNTTQGNLPPVYTVSGGAYSIATHAAIGTVNIAAGGSATITLSGGAAFSASTGYSVTKSNDNASGAVESCPFAQTASTFKLGANTGDGGNFQWLAIGK